MPIPVNIDQAHATELGPTLPATVTQDANFGGTTYTLWFKYTAPSGTVYYFTCASSTGNVGTALLTITVELASAVGTPTGSFFVSDDTDGFPAAVISATNGVGVLNFINPFITGEQADIIPSTGSFLHSDDTNNFIRLYDKDFNLLTSLAGTSNAIRYNVTLAKFFAATTAVPTLVRVINNAGTITSTIGPLAAAVDPHAITVNNAGTILYYVDKNLSRAIKRWDISGNVALTDFLVSKAGYRVIDMLTLLDDTLIIFYGNNSRDRVVYQYNAAGALLNTYSFGTDSAAILGRLAYTIDDPISFLIWTHQGNVVPAKLNFSKFQYIKVSDGSTIGTPVELPDFEVGIYSPNITLTPTFKFGTSPSCPVIVLRQDTIPVFNAVLREFSVGQDLVTYLPANTISKVPTGSPFPIPGAHPFETQFPADFTPSGSLDTGIISVQKITNPPDNTIDFNLTTNAINAIVPTTLTPRIVLKRTAALPAIANFTIMGWFKLPSLPSPGGQYYFFSLMSDDNLFLGTYYFLGCDTDSTKIQFDYGDGVTDNVTNGSTLPIGEWFHLAVVVNGLNVKVYLNGVVDVDVTLLGAPTFSFLFAYIDPVTNVDFVRAANIKAWGRSLTAEDIRLEKYSTVVTNPLSIYLATPFLTLADILKDHSGLSHDWTLEAGTPLLTTGYTAFILRSHEFQAFIVPVGSGYYIIEPTHTGYQLTYVVSNDETHDNNNNIVIDTSDDGNIVIVTVNNSVSTGFGGLYWIHPNKTNDTVWLSITGLPPTTVTEDLKIPDPFADTSFIGG